jgi:hypothetical protein
MKSRRRRFGPLPEKLFRAIAANQGQTSQLKKFMELCADQELMARGGIVFAKDLSKLELRLTVLAPASGSECVTRK